MNTRHHSLGGNQSFREGRSHYMHQIQVGTFVPILVLVILVVMMVITGCFYSKCVLEQYNFYECTLYLYQVDLHIPLFIRWLPLLAAKIKASLGTVFLKNKSTFDGFQVDQTTLNFNQLFSDIFIECTQIKPTLLLLTNTKTIKLIKRQLPINYNHFIIFCSIKQRI